MSSERTATLRTAEKLLRVGKIAAAIAEYAKVLKDAPQDWDTAIQVAALHARNGDVPAAVEAYRGVAAGLTKDGQHGRAANVLERVLILRPGDEDTLEQLAGASAANGDIAAACSHLMRIADRRIGRGELGRAIDALERAATLDPAGADVNSRLFELCVQSGDLRRARAHIRSARDCRALATVLQHAGQEAEARDLLREAYRRDPSDLGAAAVLAREYLREGEIERALEFLPPAVIGNDPAVRAAFAALFLHCGRTERALEISTQLVRESNDGADRVAELACAAAAEMADAAFAIGEVALRRWTEQAAWDSAIAMLELFIGAASDHVPALIRLIEVAVDGDRLDVADRGQEMLASTYLAQGDVTEGLAIAQDLVERDPLNPRYDALLQRARQMGRPSPDGTVAEIVPLRAAR